MKTQESVLPVVYPGGEVESPNGSALFSQDPEQAFVEAQKLVSVVAKRCTGPGYLVNIHGKQYPKIEWWTTVSASLGLFPQTVFARRLDRDDEIAYEARVEVRRQGVVIASGESMCSNREERWSKADEYAIKSMAITRASGKAYRIPLSFLAVMAGLEATPAEEMPRQTPSAKPSNGEAKGPVHANGESNQELATSKQLQKIAQLIDDPLVTDVEQDKLRSFIHEGVSKERASEAISYFLGHTILQDGKWVQTDDGVLAHRRALSSMDT